MEHLELHIQRSLKVKSGLQVNADFWGHPPSFSPSLFQTVSKYLGSDNSIANLLQMDKQVLEQYYYKQYNHYKNIIFLKQVHDNIAVHYTTDSDIKDSLFMSEADALYTSERNVVLSIRIADCVPIIFIDRKEGSYVGVIHAGWRGLSKQILYKTLYQLYSYQNKEVLSKSFQEYFNHFVFIVGPHIQCHHYPINNDVLSHFAEEDLHASVKIKKNQKYLDLSNIIFNQMKRMGIDIDTQVLYKDETILDTFHNTKDDFLFYSHRSGDVGRNIACVHIQNKT